MSTIEIMSPVLEDELPSSDLHMAERRSFPAGARLTIIDNGKPKGRELMQLIAAILSDTFPIASVDVFAKGHASRIIDEGEALAIAATADVVICGLGDCGGCSACSLGDAIRMESAGIPSTVIISDVFTGHVASFAATMGMPGYHSATVPHPVASKGTEQLTDYAVLAAAQVADQLMGANARLAFPV